MIEEYVKIYCDRCGEEALVRKARFPRLYRGLLYFRLWKMELKR